MAPKDYDPRRSSIAVGGDGGKRGILPLVLGLLALLVLAAIVVGLLSCGDDDDDGGAASPAKPAATASTQASTPSVPATPAATATLTAGAADVLADPKALGDHVGDPVTGTGLEVLSVTKGGFFVGKDASDREFVEYGGAVGEDEEGGQQLPAVGDVVGLKGDVRPAPQDPGRTLRLEADDAKVVEEDGAFINASSVTPAG